MPQSTKMIVNNENGSPLASPAGMSVELTAVFSQKSKASVNPDKSH